MAKNTSILLGSYFEEFINTEIASGRYSSTSEVIRIALRLLELEERKTKQLRKELEIGENSAIIEGFNPEEHLQDLHHKHLRKAAIA